MGGSKKVETPADELVEREIRQGRPFTPQDALARLAGPGSMKGGSPLSPQQQAENAVAAWLAANLADPHGALRTVLYRHIRSSRLLLEGADDPLAAAGDSIRHLLASVHGLSDIVREADAEWGRTMDERPRFNRPGITPDVDDPYTVESVRRLLEDALRLSN